MKRFHIKILFFLVLFINHPHESQSDIPTRFLHTPNGDTVIGLPVDFDLEIDPQGTPLIIDSNCAIYTIDPGTYVFEKYWQIEPVSTLRFSPDKTKILAIPKNSSNTFSVIDWDSQKTILKGEEDSRFLSFLNNGRFLLQRQTLSNTATLYDLEVGNQTILDCTNIMQILEIQPEEQCAIGIYGEIKYVVPDWGLYSPYTIEECYFYRWNYIDLTPIEKIALDNSKQDHTEPRYTKRIVFLRPNLTSKKMIGVFLDMDSGHASFHFRLWDIESGNEIKNLSDKTLYYDGSPLEISLDQRWLIQNDYWLWIVDIDKISENGFVSYDSLFKSMGDMVLNSLINCFYLSGYVNDMSGIYTYDISSKQITNSLPFYRIFDLLNLNTKMLFSSSNYLYTIIHSSRFCYKWDLANSTVTNINIPDPLHNLDGISTFSPDDKIVVGIEDHTLHILDSSLQTILRTLYVPKRDSRFRTTFNHSGSRLLAFSGNEKSPGIDNLIRIWRTDKWEVVRDIQGHTDSVWYAAFSPDDQRIVSASLDGTAKVWNVENGTLVSEFVGHATGVVYAEFLPDGQRVLSAGNDRRAYIWNTETATVEQTIENIHLPVQLSPDGKYLFAGSEVWELASGQVIKTLDGIAQDYTCLTLSPDGTLLLTAETNGLTKVWNVQEHILGGSGIRGFQTY